MFEFFGWACINAGTSGSETCEINEEADKLFLQALTQQANSTQVDGRVEVNITGRIQNDFYGLTIVGMTNHRNQQVIDLFQWVAQNSPTAYGILYVWDDEDYNRGGSYENEFRVWRLWRGKLQESNDPFLSPRIPTIEDPPDWAKE